MDGKLKRVLGEWTHHSVGTAAWLNSLGVSRQLANHYVTHQWIEPLGYGAFKRPHEKVEWFGAVRSLQNQLGLLVHVGALTALSAQGAAHYLRLGKKSVYLFSPPNVRLPRWFSNYDWQVEIHHVNSTLLPEDLGLTIHAYGDLDVTISSPERAILECLYLSPGKVDLVECYELVEGLQSLRPKLMQGLLEACGSIKVKRLFLYMAEKAALPVVSHLKRDAINLGNGDRSLAQGGIYNSQYGLILPAELVNHG